MKSVKSESEARHDLVNQLVEQSLAQQEQWIKEKNDLVSSWGVDPATVEALGGLDVSEIANSLDSIVERISPNTTLEAPREGQLAGKDSDQGKPPSDVQGQMAYLESALAASNKQCSVFLLELEKCRAELEEANTRIGCYSSLHEAVASISEEATVVKSRSEMAVQELFNVRTERDSLLSRLNDAEIEINDASREVITTNTVHQSLWTRVKELEADIRTMSREWDVKLEESEAANKSLAEELTAAHEKCAGLHRTIVSHATEITQLTSKIADQAKAHSDQLQRVRADGVFAETEATVQIENLKSSRNDCLDKIAMLESSVEELEEIKNYLEADNESVHLSVVDKVSSVPCCAFPPSVL